MYLFYIFLACVHGRTVNVLEEGFSRKFSGVNIGGPCQIDGKKYLLNFNAFYQNIIVS